MKQFKRQEELKLYPPRFNFEVADEGTTITGKVKKLSYEINGGIKILCGSKPTGVILVPTGAGE